MSKITMENYQEFALRTLNDDYKSIAERLSGKDNINKLHALLGIITEIKELEDAINKQDIANIKEEIGDILWFMFLLDYAEGRKKGYTSDFLYHLSYKLNNALRFRERMTPTLGHSMQIINSMYRVSIDNLDRIKSTFIYGKQYDESRVWYIIELLFEFIEIYNLDINEILQTNINKLKTRFPNKFTEEKAQNRDLKKEREVLEK